MKYLYVEKFTEEQLNSLISSQLRISSTVYDKSTKTRYLTIGAGFDIETSKIPIMDEKLTHIGYMYHWQFGLHEIAFMGRSYDSLTTFLFLLIDRIKYHYYKTKLLIPDANLSYEWQFCKKIFAHVGVTKVFAKEKRDPLLIEVGEVLQFREVIGLFGKSLAQIAKNYCGIEKLSGDLDFTKIRISSTPLTKTEIGYCVRDVEILVILCEKHIFMNYFTNGKKLPYTKTGIVRDEIKRRLGKFLKAEREKIVSWMPDEKTYEAFRMYLLKGGISGSNILHMGKIFDIKNGEPITGADITSDYPFQMLTKKFPMGKAEIVNNSEFMSTKNPYIATVRFIRFRSRTCHALMSAHKAINAYTLRHDPETILDNNRIQYANILELILNDVEYKSLKKAYKWDKAIVTCCWEFKKGYSFLPSHITTTIVEWYIKKESLKAEGAGKEEHPKNIDYKEAKEFVNSIYGMMLTALYMEEFEFNEDICDIKEKSESIPYEEACKHLFLSPYWGIWVTTYAREMLMDVITKFPNVIIQYDTDSVYFIDNGSEESERLKKYLELRNSQMRKYNRIVYNNPHLEDLGTWDFTKPFQRFKGLGSKRYMYEYLDKNGNPQIKVTVSGLRTSKTDQRSTMLHQLDYENIRTNSKTDPFDFFEDLMKIDKEHSEKLRSIYIDDAYEIEATDYLGNKEQCYSPSSIVLDEVDFTMSLSKTHQQLWIAIERYAKNTKIRSVYDLWRYRESLK